MKDGYTDCSNHAAVDKQLTHSLIVEIEKIAFRLDTNFHLLCSQESSKTMAEENWTSCFSALLSIVLAIVTAELALANTIHGYLIVITAAKTSDLSYAIWRFTDFNVYFETREENKKKKETCRMVAEKNFICSKRDRTGVEDQRRSKIRGFFEDIGLIRPNVDSRLNQKSFVETEPEARSLLERADKDKNV